MRIIDFDDMEFTLKQWGAWINDKSMIKSLGYPRCDPFRKLLGGSLPTPKISDDDALLIIRAMEELRAVNNEMAIVIDMYFRSRYTLIEIAEELNLVNRRKAGELKQTGVTWIWGYVCRVGQVA